MGPRITDRSSSDAPEPELLGRYLARETSEAEAAQVRRYLMSRPSLSRALDSYLARLDGADGQTPAPDHAQSWARLATRIRDDSTTPRPVVARGPAAAADIHPGPRHSHFTMPASEEKRAWWRRPAIAVAAAALFAVIALRTTLPNTPAPVAPPRTYTTAFAQRAELRLTDGTRVVLAPGSKLRIATDFGDERRDLYLDGQAFFDVVHDAQRPFTVYAGSASAHDIGTAFSVRSYADDGAVQIAVREGTVAMSGVGPLKAGDVGLLTTNGKTSVRHGADVDEMFGWLKGELAYTDAPLARVLADLRRWQHIDVELRDSSAAALPFTGSIGELPASAALELVSRSLGLRLTNNGNTNNGNRYVLSLNPGRTPRNTPSARRQTRRALSLSP